MHKDHLIPIKLRFSKSVAAKLKAFLKEFQTDFPMLAFLAESLDSLLRGLMKPFVRQAALDEATTPFKLSKIDINKQENLLPMEKVKLKVGVKTASKDAVTASKIPDAKVIQFKKDAVSMLSAVVSKLQENCPLRYTVVRTASCLSPESITLHQEKSKLKFSKLVEQFFEGKWLSENECEDVKLQYDKFLSSSAKEYEEKFVEFDRASDRVDLFFGKFLNENKAYGSLWKVCKILFTLSHGQSAVERSFSVNKDFLVERISLRTIAKSGL